MIPRNRYSWWRSPNPECCQIGNHIFQERHRHMKLLLRHCMKVRTGTRKGMRQCWYHSVIGWCEKCVFGLYQWYVTQDVSNNDEQWYPYIKNLFSTCMYVVTDSIFRTQFVHHLPVVLKKETNSCTTRLLGMLVPGYLVVYLVPWCDRFTPANLNLWTYTQTISHHHSPNKRINERTCKETKRQPVADIQYT